MDSTGARLVCVQVTLASSDTLMGTETVFQDTRGENRLQDRQNCVLESGFYREGVDPGLLGQNSV